jgi:phosphate transport system permease protein
VIRLLDQKQKDRLATAVFRVGGILVILQVVAIVVAIGVQALPLFSGARVGPVVHAETAGEVVLAGADRHGGSWALAADGVVEWVGTERLDELAILPSDRRVTAADIEVGGLCTVLADDGGVTVGRVGTSRSWTGERATLRSRWRPAAERLVLPPDVQWRGATANRNDQGDILLVAWASDAVSAARWSGAEQVWSSHSLRADRPVVAAAVAEQLDAVALVGAGGRLRVLRGDTLEDEVVGEVGEQVSEVRFLVGGRTLVVAGAGGSVDVMTRVPQVEVRNRGRQHLHVDGHLIQPGSAAVVPDREIGSRLASRADLEVVKAPAEWRVIRRLPPLEARPTMIAPSHRRRGFMVGGVDGSVALYHSTSGRLLRRDVWGDGPVSALAMHPRGDGGTAVIDGRRLLHRSIHNPHPETSVRSLFLPVWYEGYAAPEWVWQSSGGGEPKLSLWPLLFGTLKATLYAMLVSVPLALAAAVYVSQLAPRWLRRLVKPTVEVMAAVPSVVVGFVAALWLAPRIEGSLLQLLFSTASLPLAVVCAVLVWRLLPRGVVSRLPAGSELVFLALCVGLVVPVAWSLAGVAEGAWFADDFERFLFTEWGVRFDQRNALVVGLALGFAVIPVIFTVAEDACSAVPRSLVTAARALGATRWQTAARLVVPVASPGLFAATMLGFGRAVGETMIVLMAAGNTPLLDLSPFNGMRTMSAALAVEMPEAPVGGTLFRVLFLTGTLLFLFTLVVTTLADTVGGHLRSRYGRY